MLPWFSWSDHDHGACRFECRCEDEPACWRAAAAASEAELPDLSELHLRLGEAIAREDGYQAELDAALPLICDRCLRRISRAPVHVDE